MTGVKWPADIGLRKEIDGPGQDLFIRCGIDAAIHPECIQDFHLRHRSPGMNFFTENDVIDSYKIFEFFFTDEIIVAL